MSKAFVVLGDKTTHRGEVTSASSTYLIQDKAVALVGDEVLCPVPGHGINAITEGTDQYSEDGRALVVEGCLCECGCRVIAGTFDCSVG